MQFFFLKLVVLNTYIPSLGQELYVHYVLHASFSFNLRNNLVK